MLGATPLILSDCKRYLGVLLLFGPLTMMQMFFQVFFVTAGKPTLGLVLTITGGVTNVILDYLFMGPMGMGVIGAALATGIGQTIMAVVGIVYFFVIKKGLYFVRPVFRRTVLLESCGNGSSEMVSNLSMAIVTFLFNLDDAASPRGRRCGSNYDRAVRSSFCSHQCIWDFQWEWLRCSVLITGTKIMTS